MVEPFIAPPVNPIITIRPLDSIGNGREAIAPQTPLDALPPGTTLQGFVINRDAQNNPILRTALGDLQLQSEVFVKTGSEIVIRVDATSSTRARIVTIDGLVPQEYAVSTTRGLTQDTISPSALLQRGAVLPVVAGKAGAPPLTAGLQALLLSASTHAAAGTADFFAAWRAAGGAVAPGLLQLPVGAALKVQVLALLSPTDAVAGQNAPNGGGTAATPLPESALRSGHATAPANAAPNTALRDFSGAAALPAASVAAGGHTATTNAAQPTAAQASAIPTASAPFAAASTQPAAGASPSPPIAQPAAAQLPPARPALVPAQLHAYQVAGDAGGASSATASPVAPEPRPAPFAAAGALPAKVIGHEADGGSVLQTPVGVIKIFNGSALPLHAQLSVHISPDRAEQPHASPVAASSAAAASRPTPTTGPGPSHSPTSAAPAAQPATSTVPPATTDDEPLAPLATDWPRLDSALAQLGISDPALFHELAQALPQAGPKLANDLLFFIAAVRGGDIRPWLGQRLSGALALKSPELAARLKADMGLLQQWLLQSPLEQWNSVLLPIMHQHQVDYARLFLRVEPDEGEKQASTAKSQRFVVDVQLSHLGDMQFDGFVRQVTTKKQFDLIVRSTKPLAPDMANDIRNLFEQATTTTGYAGYLMFQHGPQSFVRPAASPPAGHAQDTQTILA